MNNAQLNELKKRYVASGAASPNDQFADHAKNAELWDADGKRMIDFAGGIGVLNVGHRHPKVVEAVKAQLDKLMHTCQTVMPYAPYVQLAEKLCKMTPIKGGEAKAMLVNSGAEALENAVKIARSATGRSGVICFDGGFHGRTMMTLAMTGKVLPYKNDFGPMPGDVFRAPFPIPYHGISDEDALAALKLIFKTDIAPKNVAAIVIEAVQGEGGFHIASPAYLKALRELCDEHGIVMIVDEVQSGFGRTGKLFAIEHSGIKPDMITMAKSLADGMPISAIVGRAELMDSSGPNSLGGTYSGNPLSCAAALAVIEVIEEEGILEKGRKLGDKLAQRFDQWQERFPHVANPRNLGAMAAFELVKDRESRAPAPELAARLVAKSKEKGLILLGCGMYGNAIRTLMPLTIEDDVLEEGLAIMEETLQEIADNA
ncbi:4-aminobutyrate--2-oxoglutarate transaminase [Hydrocarboniclastica marina]|uniref:4-aminobutyrate--2-oxoglutarate transaminase n=1 Tax=Hydrocarboniclastica marina TaxID=2259620 RepID=A0A4P7XDS4_9ALTE|nr:4-aminobutyrate--2-oxoglutarate transaminase [Hydrocarboniclastica marina]MAL97781.1 4-aminobutyrate--2-oxoglutarate transaminase [Alteromonadaceae bacterium]QCF24755.1 4-aminobutyrate--2-oxoglutarate transaminase [Hydrocarboniclastica marina]|tara:strand:- start:2035 stop:3321 length:1287 start_codon:yes stop_codon:yes gene_type:complete